jgi:ribonuclease T1
MSRNRLISIVVATVIAWAFGTGQFSGNTGNNNQGTVANSGSQSGSAKRGSVGANEIGYTSLPKEAKTVVGLIYNGGPFPYRKDGTTFQNREKRLPGKKRGYYREYTVKTPGARNRGAKRIVAGGPKSKPDAMYFTSDHYKTFKRIVGANQ